jgi:hypothetical protein
MKPKKEIDHFGKIKKYLRRQGLSISIAVLLAASIPMIDLHTMAYTGVSSAGSLGMINGEIVYRTPLVFQLSDTERGNCSFDEIYKLAIRKVITGYPDGTFKPNGKITRAEFAVMLVKALNLPLSQKKILFKDVDNYVWANQYIQTAVENGLIYGIGNNMYGPASNITLQDVATMIDRVVDNKKGNIESPTNINLVDDAQISDYAKNAIYSLIQTNILEPNSNNTIEPKKEATRDRVALLLVNALEYNDGKELIMPDVQRESNVKFGEWITTEFYIGDAAKSFVDGLTVRYYAPFINRLLGYEPLVGNEEWTTWQPEIYLMSEKYQQMIQNGETIIKNENGEVIIMAERRPVTDELWKKYFEYDYRTKSKEIYEIGHVYLSRSYEIIED